MKRKRAYQKIIVNMNYLA